MLLQILAAWPAPLSPQCTIRLPIASSTGLAFSKASLAPPHMKVRLAASAPPTPPDTGASRESILASAASLCAVRADATSMVEESTISVPCCAALSIPPPQTASVSLARRQHGDDGVDIGGRLRGGGGLGNAAPLRLGDVGREEVEALHRVPLLDEVAGHGNPHVAEPDEPDPGHSFLRSGSDPAGLTPCSPHCSLSWPEHSHSRKTLHVARQASPRHGVRPTGSDPMLATPHALQSASKSPSGS